MLREKTKTTAGLLLLVASAFLFLSNLPGCSPQTDAATHAALGAALAQSSVRLLGPGGKIVLITRNPSPSVEPALATIIGSLQQTLKKSGQRLAVTNVIQLDPLRLVKIPPGDLFELMRRLSDNDAIISLMGPPSLNASQIASLKARPKVVAWCPGNIPLQIPLGELFEKNLLHAAIISRRTPAPPGTRSGGATFDQLFELVTEQNFHEFFPAK